MLNVFTISANSFLQRNLIMLKSCVNTHNLHLGVKVNRYNSFSTLNTQHSTLNSQLSTPFWPHGNFLLFAKPAVAKNSRLAFFLKERCINYEL